MKLNVMESTSYTKNFMEGMAYSSHGIEAIVYKNYSFSTAVTYTTSLLNNSYKTSTVASRHHNQLPVCSAHASTENILYVSLMTLIMAASLFGNGLVVLAVGLSRQLRSRVTMYFVVSLAFSDLMLAMFTIPFKISSKLHNHRFCHELIACFTYIISDSFGNMASILNLFAIAFDRFVAINMPFRHTVLLCKKKAKLYITMIWTISFIWSVGGIFQWKASRDRNPFSVKVEFLCTNSNMTYYATSFCIYIVILVIMTCLYAVILCTAISQIKSIEKTEVLYIPTQRQAKMSTETRYKSKLSRELKATKTVAIIYVAFLICWTPSAVINIILLTDSMYFYSMQMNNKKMFLFLYYFFVETLPMLNTMVNPLIYSFSSKHFRRAFKNLLLPFLNNSNDWNAVSTTTFAPNTKQNTDFV